MSRWSKVLGFSKTPVELYPLFIVCGAGFAVCGWHLSRLALRNDDVTWNKAKGDCNIDGARKSTDSKTDKYYFKGSARHWDRAVGRDYVTYPERPTTV
mmetsp:Transcript_18116/g.40634  ORF Transcript_18116/g.40634 Transcript_18116/m.40634 type:complete len:98 (-) Transcript_18116:8-301(-)